MAMTVERGLGVSDGHTAFAACGMTLHSERSFVGFIGTSGVALLF
jgi:hypothetical protein